MFTNYLKPIDNTTTATRQSSSSKSRGLTKKATAVERSASRKSHSKRSHSKTAKMTTSVTDKRVTRKQALLAKKGTKDGPTRAKNVQSASKRTKSAAKENKENQGSADLTKKVPKLALEQGIPTSDKTGAIPDMESVITSKSQRILSDK